jgi:hypothetical protein
MLLLLKSQTEEDATEDQPMATGEQSVPEPTSEQVLQQLQAQLQSTQQERDRLATTFAANHRAVQASFKAAEIRQQLAVLQAKIQSMQPNQPLSNTSNQHHSANQSQPNPSPGMVAQPTFGILTSLRQFIELHTQNLHYPKESKAHLGLPPTNPLPYPNSMGDQTCASSS